MDVKELCGLLKTAEKIEEINARMDRIVSLIPETCLMRGFEQKNYAHQYDLWTHSAYTVLYLPRGMDDDIIYLAAFLHDIGKPMSRHAGKSPEDKNCHYYGHQETGKKVVEKIAGRFVAMGMMTEEEAGMLTYYVEHHDDHISLRMKHLRKHIGKITLPQFKHLMLLQCADAKAHIQLPMIQERERICRIWSGSYANEMMDRILSEELGKEKKKEGKRKKSRP